MSIEVEQLAWIEKWAGRIEANGLSSLALLVMQIARPFGFLGSQVLVMVQPLLTGILDGATVERAAALMDDPDLLNRLRMRLEGEER